MSLTPKARAYLFKLTPQNKGMAWTTKPDDAAEVQFNPTTLSYSLQNTLEKRGRDANAAQFVSQSSAKLEFDLQFDATHDGTDVRNATRKLRDFLQPQAKQNDAPPVVGFAWGSFRFKGVAESFRETLDFFSSEGVPLRSTVKLTLAAQNTADIFTQESLTEKTAKGMNADVQFAPVAASGVNRKEASLNGFENMRNPAAAMGAALSAGVQLKAAVAFSAATGAGASVGASFGAGASAGLGASAGAGFGAGAAAGAGFGASVSVSASAGLGFSAGASASAGVSASMGAFGGLRSGAGVGTSRLAPTLLPSASAPPGALAAASGQFALGGAAISATSSGLRADVGISARLRFD